MRLKLEKRAEPSRLMLYATPVGSVVLTMIVGAIIFTVIGYDGLGAVYQVFLAPVLTTYKWQDVAIKASPLILIGVGLAVGNRAAIWNIGAEGQYVAGGLAGTGVGLLTQNMTGLLDPADDACRGVYRRRCLGRHSGAAAHAVQRQRDALQPDDDLCGHPSDELSCCRPVEGSVGIQLPADGAGHRRPDHADLRCAQAHSGLDREHLTRSISACC